MVVIEHRNVHGIQFRAGLVGGHSKVAGRLAGAFRNIGNDNIADAYHSLSIEGCRVSYELIERVRSGNWNPDSDKNNQNTLAARGYWLAFLAVKESLFTSDQNSCPSWRKIPPLFLSHIKKEPKALPLTTL